MRFQYRRRFVILLLVEKKKYINYTEIDDRRDLISIIHHVSKVFTFKLIEINILIEKFRSRNVVANCVGIHEYNRQYYGTYFDRQY